MSAVKQHFSDRLNDMKSAYEEHGGGLKGAAAAALEGVRGAYEDGFNAIDNLTGDMSAGFFRGIHSQRRKARAPIGVMVRSMMSAKERPPS